MARLLATSRFATDLLEREPAGVQAARRPASSSLLRPRGAAGRDARHRWAPGRPRGDAITRCAPYAGGSCCASPRPTCPGWSSIEEVAEALTAVTLRDARGGAGDRRPGRRVRDRRRAADPDGARVDGPSRRARDELRQRRRRDVRARPAARRRRRGRDRARRRRSPTSCAGCCRCPGSDPALEVDADLRPEGKQGPLVRTLESYAAYYAKWSAVWEAQALLRAEAVVGDADAVRAVRRAGRPAALPGRRD